MNFLQLKSVFFNFFQLIRFQIRMKIRNFAEILGWRPFVGVCDVMNNNILMKKNVFFLTSLFILSVMAGCSSGKGKSADSEEWWYGTFSNDTVSLVLNPESVCRIVTADSSVGAEYVWDVDHSALLVTDAKGGLHLYMVDDGMLVSPDGAKLVKRGR